MELKIQLASRGLSNYLDKATVTTTNKGQKKSAQAKWIILSSLGNNDKSCVQECETVPDMIETLKYNHIQENYADVTFEFLSLFSKQLKSDESMRKHIAWMKDQRIKLCGLGFPLADQLFVMIMMHSMQHLHMDVIRSLRRRKIDAD